MSSGGFWSLTPTELSAEVVAFNAREKDRHRRDIWVAWHTAAFTRCQRLPDLNELLGDDKPATPQQERRRNQEGILALFMNAGAMAVAEENAERAKQDG